VNQISTFSAQRLAPALRKRGRPISNQSLHLPIINSSTIDITQDHMPPFIPRAERNEQCNFLHLSSISNLPYDTSYYIFVCIIHTL
jgi:hypothetical protein